MQKSKNHDPTQVPSPNNEIGIRKGVKSVALGTAVLTAVGAIAAYKGIEAVDHREAGPHPYRLYSVKSGDNFWEIAEKAFPKTEDIRKDVFEISHNLIKGKGNHLSGQPEPGDLVRLNEDARIGIQIKPQDPDYNPMGASAGS